MTLNLWCLRINGDGFGYLCYVKWIYDIRQFLQTTSWVSIKYIARSCNSLVDGLAKVGVWSPTGKVRVGSLMSRSGRLLVLCLCSGCLTVISVLLYCFVCLTVISVLARVVMFWF